MMGCEAGGNCTGWDELGRHRGPITSLVWSSEGSCLFSGSYDGEIRKWQSAKMIRLIMGASSSFPMGPQMLIVAP